MQMQIALATDGGGVSEVKGRVWFEALGKIAALKSGGTASEEVPTRLRRGDLRNRRQRAVGVFVTDVYDHDFQSSLIVGEASPTVVDAFGQQALIGLPTDVVHQHSFLRWCNGEGHSVCPHFATRALRFRHRR